MEIFFPHDKFLDEKFPHHIHLFSTPPPTKKCPWKRLYTSQKSVHFWQVRYHELFDKYRN